MAQACYVRLVSPGFVECSKVVQDDDYTPTQLAEALEARGTLTSVIDGELFFVDPDTHLAVFINENIENPTFGR